MDTSDSPPVGCSLSSKFVEPVLFLTVTFTSIFSLITTNVVEIQYCKAILNIENRSICLNHTYPHFTDMEKFMSTYSMFQTISISIFPAVSAIFLGPWSDTFGRKPLLLSTVFGCAMTCTLWTYCHNTYLHPYFFLLFDLPLALSGSGVVFTMAAYCYLCDVTTPATRAFRMGIFFAIINAGSLIGSLVTPYLQNISYNLTLTVSAFLGMVSFLYILLFLEESVPTTEIQRRAISKNPIQWSFVKSIYETCYVAQPSQVFNILFYFGLSTIIATIQMTGEGTVFYLFLQKELGWTLLEYTHLLSLAVITSALASCLATSKILALSDLEIICFGVGIRLVCGLVFFYGAQSWLVYVTNSLGNMGGICGTIARNFISKIIKPDDLGKVFAALSLLDALAPLIGSPIYNLIYSNTLETNPKMIFLFSAFLCLILEFLLVKIVNLYISLLRNTPSMLLP